MKFSIDPIVFDKFPNLIVALPVIKGFDNKKNSQKAMELLRGVEKGLREKTTIPDFLKDPRVTSYIECFKQFGVDPEKLRPAHVALSVRVLEGGALPDINPMVNLYNALSLKYCTPFGGENLEAVYGDFYLKFAKGGEQWIPIGGGKSKPAVKGELIWGDDFDLSTRALNWRQCDRTKMTGETTSGYFVMDGFENVNKGNIEKAAVDFCETATKLFGGVAKIYWLDKAHPEIEIPFKSKRVSKETKMTSVTKKQEHKTEVRKAEYKKGTHAFELAGQILSAVNEVFPKAKIKLEDIGLEHPTVEEYGDYSTNIALKLSKELGKNPNEIAEKIVFHLQETSSLEASVAGPGFINISLDNDFFLEKVKEINEQGIKYGQLPSNGKKIVIEIVSPNINKPLHIGHLRNGALGMSIANAYKTSGWKVTRDEINNDRGLHIMKAAYGYLLFGQSKPVETKDWKELLKLWLSDPKKWETPTTTKRKPDFFVGEFYVKGEKFLTENEEFANKQLSNMLQEWEAEEKGVWSLWKTMAGWVHEGIDTTYLRIGVEHDKKWYEHLLYKEGKDVIMDALKKGVLEKLPDGAIQANLEKYGLANKILIRRDGTAIYMTFDIALTRHKVAEFKADKYVWVVGNDQIDHFKRLFVIFEMLGLGKKEDFYHLAYGMVRIPGGKMSSRLGNVVLADDLIDKIVGMTKKLMDERVISVDSSPEEKGKIAEAVGVGAIKYAMLKVNPMIDVVFDMEKSVSLEGDSGPYLQYTYARARSVLRKANFKFKIYNLNSNFKFQISNLKTEEVALLRFLYRFPEVVEIAAKNFSPNLLCSYLFELAKRFNTFYANCPILENDFRISLTQAVSIVLKNGLTILGIEAVEKM